MSLLLRGTKAHKCLEQRCLIKCTLTAAAIWETTSIGLLLLLVHGLYPYATPLRVVLPVLVSKLLLLRRIVVLIVERRFTTTTLRLSHLLLICLVLVSLFVKKLPIHLLALPTELLGLVHILQLHVMEEEDIQQNEQLLAVNAQRVTDLCH